MVTVVPVLLYWAPDYGVGLITGILQSEEVEQRGAKRKLGVWVSACFNDVW